MEAGGGKARLYGIWNSAAQVPSASQAVNGTINNAEIKQPFPHRENKLENLSQNT